MFLHIQDESICFLMDIFLAFQAVEAKVLPFDKLQFLLSGYDFVTLTFIGKFIFFIHKAFRFSECGLTKPFLITTSILSFLWVMFRGQVCFL